MKLERTHNAKKGIIYGFVNKLVLLLLPFIIQTIMIRLLGADYVGIRGLFSAILQVFNLAELGLGSAIVFSMYKPISEGNEEELCALLNLYKNLYRLIGLFILIVGICIIPFLPSLINGDCPEDIDLTVVYLLYLLNTVLTYWLFAYKTSILDAYQRFDIVSKVSTISHLILYLLQIMVLIVTKNYYIYLIIAISGTVLNNFLIRHYTNKYYPHIQCQGCVNQEIKNDIKTKVMGLMIYKICGATRNTFDSIFVSMFIGLIATAMYNNYYYIISSVSGIIGIISSSLLAGVGNSIKLDSIQKNRDDMEKLDCVYMLISGICTIYILCLYEPFMEIWVGKDLQFPFSVVIMFVIYFYMLKMGDIRCLYADAAGLWWENRYRTVAEAIFNVILNYLFVYKWGIYGIIGATMLTVFLFGYVSSAYILYKYYFKSGLFRYFFQHIIYATATAFSCVIVYKICSLFTGNVWTIICVRVLICSIIGPFCYLMIFMKNKTVTEACKWIIEKL